MFRAIATLVVLSGSSLFFAAPSAEAGEIIINRGNLTFRIGTPDPRGVYYPQPAPQVVVPGHNHHHHHHHDGPSLRRVASLATYLSRSANSLHRETDWVMRRANHPAFRHLHDDVEQIERLADHLAHMAVRGQLNRHFQEDVAEIHDLLHHTVESLEFLQIQDTGAVYCTRGRVIVQGVSGRQLQMLARSVNRMIDVTHSLEEELDCSRGHLHHLDF